MATISYPCQSLASRTRLDTRRPFPDILSLLLSSAELVQAQRPKDAGEPQQAAPPPNVISAAPQQGLRAGTEELG